MKTYLNRYLGIKQLKCFLLILFLSQISLSCAGIPIAPLSTEQKEHFYDADFNTTWRVVIDVLNDRSLPITTIEKESGIIVTDFVIISPSAPLILVQPPEIARQGRYKLNISVVSASEKTKVRINAHFERLSTGFLENFPTWKPQNSTGVLEAELFEAIQLAISQKR